MEENITQAQIDEILTEEEVQRRFEKSKQKAEKLLEDKDKMDRFLERLEKKLALVPHIGGVLSDVPVLIAMVKAYIEKKYTAVPLGSMIAIVGSLLYFLSPVDLIPDILPGIGLVDDAAVIAFALKLVHDDVAEFRKWREENQLA